MTLVASTPSETLDEWADIKAHLVREEGCRSTVYIDHRGVPTIGIGHNLRCPLSQAAIDRIYADDCGQAIAGVKRIFASELSEFSVARVVALVSMCFQLGEAGLQEFRLMIKAIKAGQWEEAAKEALLSRWAEQVPERARRVSEMLRTGKLSH